jgi:MoaA/NifB/PqqE/SkfB family radical SAM enzyme
MFDKQQIFDLLKKDKSSWLTAHCDVPFNTISIDYNGDIYQCTCSDWLPKKLTNILNCANKEEFLKLLDSNPVKDSILDRSHRYCLGTKCPALQGEYRQPKSYFTDYETVTDEGIEFLHLNIDNSCNLACPTCRNSTIINKNNEPYQSRLQNILDKIDEYFFNPQTIKVIHCVGNGEFLSSKLLVDWLLEKSKLDIKFALQTNGTLLYKNQTKISAILKKSKELYISIDASNSELYSAVRLNGSWNDLLKSLNWIKFFSKYNNIEISYNFTVSNANYHDMLNFIAFAQSYDVHRVYFSKVDRWPHISDEQWKSMNVFNASHPNNKHLLQILENDALNLPFVQKNF